MLADEVREMVAELDRNKLDESWVRKERFARNEVIQNETFRKEFFIVARGVLHLENKNFRIIHFFFNGDVVNRQIAMINIEKELELVCDTEVLLIYVNREYFFDFATKKPLFLKWLLEETLYNNKKLYHELIKKELPIEKRIILSLQYICERSNEETDCESQQVPIYMNKMKIAKYAGVFCTELFEKWSLLINENVVEEKDGLLFIKKK